jgi:hypothetical protein
VNGKINELLKFDGIPVINSPPVLSIKFGAGAASRYGIGFNGTDIMQLGNTGTYSK